MNDLDTRLQETLDRVADTTTVHSRFDEIARPQRRRSLPRVAVPVVAFVAVVAVFAIPMIFTNIPESDVGGSAAPMESFPVPGYVPPGAELVYGDYAVPDPANPDAVGAVIARTTADGFTDGVVVTVYHASGAAIDIPEGEPVVVDGEPATLTRNNGDVTLWWQQDNRVVSVRSATGDANLAEDIAAAVNITNTERFGEEVLSFGTLPDGFTDFAAPRLAPRQPHPYVSIQTPTGQEAGEPEVATIEVFDDTLSHVAGAFGAASTVEIAAGVEALLVDTDTETTYMWSRESAQTVMVSGTFPPAEVRSIAEGLEFVSEAAWRQQYDSRPQLPTTTTTQAAASTEPSPVTTDGDDPGTLTTTLP